MLSHPDPRRKHPSARARRALRALALTLLALLTAGLSAQAQAEDVQRLEPGDPGYRACEQQTDKTRCYRLRLEPGERVTLSEADFALPPGSQLALVPRDHPFSTRVGRQDFTLAVPEDYLWAAVRLETRSGDQVVLLAYSDRAVARAALASYERVFAARSERPVSDAQAFFAEQADLDGDGLAEVIVHGGDGRSGARSEDAMTLVTSWDGKRALMLTPSVYPQLRRLTLDRDDQQGALPIMVEGQSGCEAVGRLTLWRLVEERLRAAGGAAVEASALRSIDDGLLLDTNALGQVVGLPAAWEANRPRWIRLDVSGQRLVGVDLFATAEACAAGQEGVRLFWQHGVLRARHL